MDTSSNLALLQWPAMLVTVIASWFVTSRYKDNRWIGFVAFLASNVLWTIWGLHSGATALVVLQFCLAALNILGLWRSGKKTGSDSEPAKQ
ncbi:MAG: hypothetical protein H7Z40_23500 [Phycisphaerae bacterium]|nr:hypothetical protein [Gemmatimonadaceae bacterium]